jgi:uncharacterized membrane protein YdjX (TVP38/TMEM64 family)
VQNRTKKILLVSIVVAAIGAVRFSGVFDHVTLEALKTHGQALRERVYGHYALAVIVYTVGYALAVAVSVPGDIVLSVAGGYFFGTFLGTFYINIGATTGALCSFLFSRYVAGDWLQGRFSHHLDRFNREVEARGYLYLLIVRLIPLFPFVLVNLLSGLTRVSLTTYLWTTSLGIIPVSLIYAYTGSQLGSISSTRDLFTGWILLAFLLLAVLALAPLVLKKLRFKAAR